MVNVVTNTGAEPAKVAKDYNIPDSTLRDSITKYRPSRKKIMDNNSLATAPINHTMLISTSTPVPYQNFLSIIQVELPNNVSCIISDDKTANQIRSELDSYIVLGKQTHLLSNSLIGATERLTVNDLSIDIGTIEFEFNMEQ